MQFQNDIYFDWTYVHNIKVRKISLGTISKNQDRLTEYFGFVAMAYTVTSAY